MHAFADGSGWVIASCTHCRRRLMEDTQSLKAGVRDRDDFLTFCLGVSICVLYFVNFVFL